MFDGTQSALNLHHSQTTRYEQFPEVQQLCEDICANQKELSKFAQATLVQVYAQQQKRELALQVPA